MKLKFRGKDSINELKKIGEENLKARQSMMTELKLQLNEAERQMRFKERLLASSEGVDADLLREEIEESKRRVDELMDRIRKLGEDITEGKTFLVNLRIIELDKKLNVDGWEELVLELEKEIEESGGDSFRELCERIKRLVQQSKSARLQIIKKKEV